MESIIKTMKYECRCERASERDYLQRDGCEHSGMLSGYGGDGGLLSSRRHRPYVGWTGSLRSADPACGRCIFFGLALDRIPKQLRTDCQNMRIRRVQQLNLISLGKMRSPTCGI